MLRISSSYISPAENWESSGSSILDKSAYQDWIQGSEEDVYDLAISNRIEFYKVSTLVNNPKNNSKDCCLLV